MSHTVAHVLPPLHGCVALVVDGTTGVGRRVASQLCALGAAVAVVGAGHPGRGDDAATNAAFLCKELAGIGLVALPYQADVERPESFAALTGQIAADLGPVTVGVVVVPGESGGEELASFFRVLSGVVAASLPAGAEHIEVDVGREGAGLEKAAQAVVERLARLHEPWRGPSARP